MPRPTFRPFDPRSPVRKTRRRLPHWTQEGCVYFITWRLVDSIPQEKLRLWREERAEWLERHPRPWSEATSAEYRKKFPARMQRWMDMGYGSCVLQRPEIGSLVERALRHFDGARYVLDEYVIMPNLVHLLAAPLPGHELSEILHSWKSFTTHEANRTLHRRGTLWLEERFDHIIRNDVQLDRLRRYIRANPGSAGLPLGAAIVGTGIGIGKARQLHSACGAGEEARPT